MKCRHVLLLDTSGSFKLAIRLPTGEYRPRSNYKKQHLQYVKKWRQRNKKKLKEYGHNYYKQHLKQFKQYYQKNRQHILTKQKQYRNRNRKKH